LPRLKLHFVIPILVLALAATPRQARAQATVTTLDTFTLGVMLGVGGSIDESDTGLDNLTFQISGSVVTEPNVEVGFRLGQMSFGSDERLGDVLDSDMTYLTFAGEYTFGEATYQSGMFIGLGLYRFAGTEIFTTKSISTTKFGLTLGVTGEFDLSDRFGILAELSGHAVPGAPAEFFGAGLVGLAIYFN
jgi:hypothetical protein